MVLDGEAQPAGGMGVCRQAKDEIYDCPPVLLIIGRADDGWLATWSRADAVVSHPIDPIALAHELAGLMRERPPSPADPPQPFLYPERAGYGFTFRPPGGPPWMPEPPGPRCWPP